MDDPRAFIDSPYLAGGVPRRIRLHARRALWVSTGVLATGVLCAAIAGTWFAVDGWAYALYWLHDHVYLYLKGHLWTRFFPYSLIWMLPLAAAVAYLCIDRCVHGPLSLRPHASAVLVAVRFRPTRALLRRWCWLVGRRKWGWQFIFQMIEQEIENRLDGIVRGPAFRRRLDAATDLCMLRASLSRAAPDSPGANTAVDLLYEALVLRRVFGGANPGRLDRAVSDELHRLMGRTSGHQSPEAPPASRSMAGQRERHAVGHLLAGARDHLAPDTPAAPDPTATHHDPLVHQLHRCLEFSDALDAMIVARERERLAYRARGETAAESVRNGSDRLRACLMHAYLVAHATGEAALARAVHSRLEGYLLASSLAQSDSNGTRRVFRARDFGTLNRLTQLQGERVVAALRQVRDLDESVFAAHDLLAPVRQADLLRLSAGWSEDG